MFGRGQTTVLALMRPSAALVLVELGHSADENSVKDLNSVSAF